MEAKASRASLEEEIYLRSLTGFVVAEPITRGKNRILLVTLPDRICSSLSASISTALLASRSYRGDIARIVTYEEGLEAKLRSAIDSFKPDAVFIVFGGEDKMSQVAEKAKLTVRALKNIGYKGAIIFHVRTWLATKQLSTILAEKDLADYLAGLELRTFTANMQEKKFLFHNVKIEGGSAKPEKYHEVKLIDEHVELLSRSLPPPE